MKLFTDYRIPESWRFVPIRDGSKAPIGTGWQDRPFTWEDCPKPGVRYQGQTVGAVGLLFGHGGIVGLDFDGASVDPMLAGWGVELPPTTVISSGRPWHCLKLYLIPEPYRGRVQTAKFKTGVVVQEYGKDVHEQLEIRWVGSQSLICGTHPESGNQYQVLSWADELPELPPELLHRMLKPDEQKHVPPAGHELTDVEWATSYLSFINPEGLGWYEWRDVLLACHAAGMPEAEVRAWSGQSSKHTDRGFDGVWRHIKGRPGIGLGTLGMMAKAGGWQPQPKISNGLPLKQTKPLFEPETYQSRLEQIAAAAESEREPLIAHLSQETKIPFGAIERRVAQLVSKNQSPPVEAQDLTDFLGGENEPLRWQVEGLLPQGETVIEGGEPKAGKTLLAVDLAYAVAAGEPFLGAQTAQGGVLIVSTDESPQSTRSKLLRRGFKPGMPVAVLTHFDIENMEPLVAAIEKYRPALVIVDSLKSITKNLTVSENSPEFANFIYKLKEVFSAYGCAAVLIHHISKNRDHTGVNKLRGSTAIAGSAWAVWLLTRTGENSVTLECISRDIPGESIAIALNQENMSFERQGTPPPTEGALTEKIVNLLQTRTNSHTGLEVSEIKESLGIENKYIYKILIEPVCNHWWCYKRND